MSIVDEISKIIKLENGETNEKPLTGPVGNMAAGILLRGSNGSRNSKTKRSC